MVKYLFSNTDPLNELHKRNVQNTSIYDYNCAGYALGTFSWYCPSDCTHDDDQVRGRTRQYRLQAIKIMLRDFPNLRLIKKVKDATPNEIVIAFRVAKHDFHYMKRGRNGVWYEKCGNGNIVRRTVEEVFDKHSWHYRYKGPIVLFAMLDYNRLQVEG